MDYQSKLLDKQYLEARLGNIGYLKREEFYIVINESDRALSKTIYIEFWRKDGEKNIKLKTIRISDHSQPGCPHIQFLIKPYDVLTKRKKEQFIKMVKNTLNTMEKKMLFWKLNQIGEK